MSQHFGMGDLGGVGLSSFGVDKKNGLGQKIGVALKNEAGWNFSVSQKNGVGLNVLLFNQTLEKTLCFL